VAKIHEKIVNQRNHFYHNLSLLLVSNYDTIVIEDLAVAKMSQSRSKMMNKLINESSWRTFISMLEYKSRWHDKTVHKVDRYFASTQICSKCGTKSGHKDLSVREWECSCCGATHDRDLNA
jgi:putative transposase